MCVCKLRCCWFCWSKMGIKLYRYIVRTKCAKICFNGLSQKCTFGLFYKRLYFGFCRKRYITLFLGGKGSSRGCGRALSSPATSLPFARCGILLLCTSSLPGWSHSVFKVTCCHWIHFLPAESLTSVPHTFWIQRFISYVFIFNFCESLNLLQLLSFHSLHLKKIYLSLSSFVDPLFKIIF